MGQITPALLELMGIPWELFPSDETEIEAVLERAKKHMHTHQTPYALVMPHGIVQASEKPAEDLDASTSRGRAMNGASGSSMVNASREYEVDVTVAFHQDDVLRTVQKSARSTDALLATTGFTGRALYAVDDRANQFYMVGSMGCVSSLGLGLATVRPDRRVIVLDGDGALLMRMGSLATNGYHIPANLVHLVLDNGCHDSTGSQRTVSSCVEMVQLASACGYPRSVRISTLEELSNLLNDGSSQLTFAHIKTRPRDNRKLPRPTISPADVARRFQGWLQSTAN
jgi:phosphonopyruvate decarboxylase